MLNKKDLGKNKVMFKLWNSHFEQTIENLTAEYIILHEAENIDPRTLKVQISKCLHDLVPFALDCINGEFVRNGEFISYNVAKASKSLFKSLTDRWLDRRVEEVGEKEIEVFKNYFYENYFSKLATINISEEAKSLVPIYDKQNRDVMYRQQKVLRGIIAGHIEKGENVLYYICPVLPNLAYKITVEHNSPYFLRLVQREGDNIFVKNTDISSAVFLMACVESMNFELNEHKREFLLRLASLLLNEGYQF